MVAMFEISLDDLVVKVLVFVLIQALVYLILSNSSSIFSRENMMRRSLSFRPPRTRSIRRIVNLFSDMPLESSGSGSFRGMVSPRTRGSADDMDDQ